MDATAWQIIVAILAIIVSIIMYLVSGRTTKTLVGIILIIILCIAGVYIVGDISSQQTSSIPPTPTVPLLSAPTPADTLPSETNDSVSPSTAMSRSTPTPAPTSANTLTGSSGSNPTSIHTSTPTPAPTQPPEKSTTELSFGETVSGAITATTNSNTYRVVLTQAGRLTLTLPYVANGVAYLHIKWSDSNGAQIRHDSQGFSASYSRYSQYVDLEAGTYYIEIAKFNSHTGVYELSVAFVEF